MTLERDELALKAALDGRRPPTLPPELPERLERIPAEVEPLRPLPVRMALGIAPWAAVAAVLMFLFVLPLRDALPGVAAPRPTTSEWDPATTGGVISPGIFGIPWVPWLLWASLVMSIVTVRQLRREGSIPAPRTWPGLIGAQLHLGPPRSRTGSWLLVLLVMVPAFAAQFVAALWDPLSAADPFAPGPNVAEILKDGMWMDDAVERSGGTEFPGDPCFFECSGPRYLYRVLPGERYWWLETIRNDGPLPITLLGRKDPGQQPSTIGMGLLRDPSVLSAEPSNLRPLVPVLLGAGQTVTVAMVATAERCADPAGSSFWGGYAISRPIVYDVLGWRRIGTVLPHFSVTTAGCE